MPASLLALAVADVIRLPDAARRSRWIRGCLAALAVPAVGALGVLVWGWAGASHLGPLCAAFATPQYRHARPLELRSLLIDSDQGSQPAWAEALLRRSGGPLDSIESLPARTGDVPAGTSILQPMAVESPGSGSSAIQSTHVLEARRRTHHRNRWFTVEMDRFRLRDRGSGLVLAQGDELWIRAGRATYHCGIGSGPRPTADTSWPDGPGVARFVSRLLVPPPQSRD